MTIYAGANDLLRPGVDLDALAHRYDEAVGRLSGTGATVLLWTGFDLGWAPVFGRLRGRVAIYNELVRGIAGRHGTGLVDFWRLGATATSACGTWTGCTCRRPATSGWRSRCSTRSACRTPWVKRRLTGISSGDGVSPKRPTLSPI